MVAAAIFEKSKNHDISVGVEAISTKFGTASLTLLNVPVVKNMKNFKIQDGGSRHTEKLKNRYIAGIRTHNH